MEPYARVDAYFGMREELRALLNREIDLVMVGAVKNPYISVTSNVRSSCYMPRDERAYLADILESCNAIKNAVRNLDLAAYQDNRLVRSSVEREFIIIGEAMAALARSARQPSRRSHEHVGIVDFRNQLITSIRPWMMPWSGRSSRLMYCASTRMRGDPKARYIRRRRG